MNPYRISEPTAISFSGGRTSAFMLYKCLEAHDGRLPDEAVVTFANTGKEMAETYDFVQACADNWGVDIVWLEYAGRSVKPETVNQKRPLYDYQYKVVDYNSASRNGEPFAQLISDMGSLPNPVGRACSGQLKIRTMKRYLIDQGFTLPYLCLVGLRGDEQRRAVKMHGKINEQQDIWCPLYVDGKTKEDVGNFWDRQNFDLALPNNNGLTDWGNCDLCFLKGMSKKMSIIEARPDLADWWSEQEQSLSKAAVGRGAYFRKDQPSYTEMKVIASNQGSLFGFDNDESIPCFCGD